MAGGGFSLAAHSAHLVDVFFLFSLHSRLIKMTASESVCICVCLSQQEVE